MREITINMGRIDWPCYRSFKCTEDELTVCRFMELHPELFVNSKVLFVCDGEGWSRLDSAALLEANGDYRLVSVVDVDALNDRAQVCSVCERSETGESVSALRYHVGKLISQEWVHGITICWEWSCCNRIVQHTQVESHDATTGCNVGKCSNCRDLSAYQQAIAKREKEMSEAF